MVRQRTYVASRGTTFPHAVPGGQRNGRPMFYGGPDPITMNKMEKIVANFQTMSGSWLDREGRLDPSQDPRRDLDDECGYPKHQWASEDYKDLIDREPLACLLNEIEAIESWSSLPELYEDDDEEVSTDLEIGWSELPRNMGPEPSHFSDVGGTALWSLMLLADIHCGEGRHGTIVLGLKDGKGMGEPATPRKGMGLKWMRSFPEYLCRVTSFDMDDKSDRYMMPMTYDITFSDPRESAGSGVQENYTTESVHWSRVVHICDRWHTAPSTFNFAIPRLRPVRDPVLDYRKVRASSAEMYYKAAFVGLHFGTHPQLGADVNVNRQSLEDMYEQYINGLQRGLFTNGMTVDQLAPGVVDPNPQLLAQITPICMKKRIPIRILMGSERGELASGDDKIKWNNRMGSRRLLHNGPSVIHPVVNRLVNLGVLPTPVKPKKSDTGAGLKLWWPDLASQTEEERVKILLTRTQAYAQYVLNDIGSVIPPLEYMTKFDNISPEEAETIIQSAEEAQIEKDAEAQALADEHGLVPDMTAEGFKEPTPPPASPEEEHQRAIELEKVKAKAKPKPGKK